MKKMICAITSKITTNTENEAFYINVDVKLAIMEKISELLAIGITDFITNAENGMALYAAEIIIALRDIRIQQGMSAFRLHVVAPCETHACEWDDEAHEKYYKVHEDAGEVLLLYRQCHDKCYENCERFIIDQCDILLCDDENEFAAQYATIHDKGIVICKVPQLIGGET